MDGTGDHHVEVFPHMWRLDQKGKCMHKFICDLIDMYIHTYMCVYIYIYIYERKRGREKI
jgi:hypothetical protein